MVVRAFTRPTATAAAAFPRYRRWCGKPTARHDMGRTRRWIHHGFMSRFPNQITEEEVVRAIEPMEEERPLLATEPQSTREERARSEAPIQRNEPRMLTGIGLSRRLSNRHPGGQSTYQTTGARSKKILRRLNRGISVLKKLESRVEDLASAAEAAKLEAEKMRDDSYRAWEEAYRARDEAAHYRDAPEGLRVEAKLAKNDACRMRDEAAVCRDDAQRIYADVTAAMDDDQGSGYGHPYETDGQWTSSSESTEVCPHGDGSDLPSPTARVSTSSQTSSVEEVPTTYDAEPLRTIPTQPLEEKLPALSCGMADDVSDGDEERGEWAGEGRKLRRSTRCKKKSSTLSSPYTVAHVRPKHRPSTPSEDADVSK